MKIGLISDVHGDLKALDQALRLLEHKHHADTVWCAGDLVGRGTKPNEVVRRVVGAGIPTVLGNHDEMVLLMTRHKIMLKQTDENGWSSRSYTTQTIETLGKLPRTYRTQIAGRTVVMVHGSPRSNLEGISLNPQHRLRELLWLEKISADILVTGHTHAPLILRDQRGMIVNPGSLFDPSGFQRASSETYGLLDVDQMRFDYYPLWD